MFTTGHSASSIDSIAKQAASILMADTARKLVSIGIFDHGNEAGNNTQDDLSKAAQTIFSVLHK